MCVCACVDVCNMCVCMNVYMCMCAYVCMQVHADKCEFKDEFEVDKILACEGHICSRKYKIRWKGYTEEDDSWVARSNVHPECIRDFELANGLYVRDWPFRCDVCDLPCSSAHGVKIHRALMHKAERKQNFAGTLAEEAAIKKIVEEQQANNSMQR